MISFNHAPCRYTYRLALQGPHGQQSPSSRGRLWAKKDTKMSIGQNVKGFKKYELSLAAHPLHMNTSEIQKYIVNSVCWARKVSGCFRKALQYSSIFTAGSLAHRLAFSSVSHYCLHEFVGVTLERALTSQSVKLTQTHTHTHTHTLIIESTEALTEAHHNESKSRHTHTHT